MRSWVRGPGSKIAADPSTSAGPFFHAIAALSLVVWASLAAVSHDAAQGRLLAFWIGCQWGAWVLLGIAACKIPPSRPYNVVLWAIAFRAVGVFALPVLEDDPYRFLWDGRNLIEYGNPYLKPPSASFGDPALDPDFQLILDQINHPDLTTVYGPVAQWAFGVSYLVAPGRLWPWKLILAASELATWIVLAPRISHRALLLLTWCPLAVAETAFNAHPDSLGIALATAAWTTRSSAMAGLLWAASGGTKAFGWILAPIDLRRRHWRAALVMALTLAVLYLPFLVKGGRAEFSGLAAMAHDWEFNSSFYAVARMWMGPDIARTLGVLLFGWVWSGFAFGRRSPETGLKPSYFQMKPPPGMVVFGTLFLLSSTVNAWYLLWLLPFAAVNPNPMAVAAFVLAPLSYCTNGNMGISELGEYDQPLWVGLLEYGLLAVVGCLWCYRNLGKSRSIAEESSRLKVGTSEVSSPKPPPG